MKKIINFISKYKYVFLILVLVVEFANYLCLEEYYSLSMKAIDAIYRNGTEVDMSSITLVYSIVSDIRMVVLYLFTPLLGYSFLKPMLSKIIKNNILCIIVCVYLSLFSVLLFSSLVLGNIATLIINHKFVLGNIISKISSPIIGSFKMLIGANIIDGLKNIPGETDFQTIRAIVFELIYALPLIETIVLILKRDSITTKEDSKNESI